MAKPSTSSSPRLHRTTKKILSSHSTTTKIPIPILILILTAILTAIIIAILIAIVIATVIVINIV